MNRTEFIKDFAESIARMEGFYSSRSVAARNNNPGNLRSWGKTPVLKGYAVFPTEEKGWAALKAQIGKNIDRGLTTYEFFAGKKDMNGSVVYPGYAPSGDDNDPRNYAKFVAKRLNIPSGTYPNGDIREPIDMVLLEVISGAE